MSTCETFASAKRPFIGLRPFEYLDRDFFFGRQQELCELEPLVSRSRFVAVVGSSGSGKSSLIRAGLRPRLEASDGERLRWLEMHPADAPIRQLAGAVARLDDEDHGLAEALTDRLELLLRRSSFGIAEALSLFPSVKCKTLLLLVDQFEELFRFADLRAERNHDSTTAAEHRDEATAFVRLLLTAVSVVELPIHIVVTMRSDFIGDCARFHGLPEAVTRDQFLVPGLTRDQRAAAICGPVNRAGGKVDPGLVQGALNDTNEDSDQLPILQHAMMRCWEYARSHTEVESGAPCLTLDHYNKVGGVAKALSIHANEILSDLANVPTAISLKLATKRAFQALTETDQDGRVVRRPQRFGDLVKYIETDTNKQNKEDTKQAVRNVVSRFASSDCSFLRAPPPDDLQDASIIDIGHEALIRRWEMLKGDGETDWIHEEQSDADQYRDLVRSAVSNGIIPEEELPAVERWWSQRRPNPFWAQRYTRNNADRFNAVVQLLQRSRAKIEKLEMQRRTRWAVGIAAIAALGLVLFLFYYDHAETQRALAVVAAEKLALENHAIKEHIDLVEQTKEAIISREKDFRSLTVASLATATLSPRIVSGAADALAIALLKQDDLPNVPAYIQLLYRGLGELREKRRIVDIPAQVFGIEFAPAGDLLLAVAPGSPSLMFFRTSDGVLVDTLPVSKSGFVMSARWSPDGERIYIGTSPVAEIITPCSRELLRQYFHLCDDTRTDISVAIGTREQPAGAGVWSPDGNWILTGGFQGPASLWNTSTGAMGPSFADALPPDPKEQLSTSVAISSDGTRMAVGAVSGAIYVLDLKSMALQKSLKPDGNGFAIGPFSLAFDPNDANLLLAVYATPVARLWDIDSGRSAPLLHSGNVLQGAFDPGGRFAVTASNDGVVRLWTSIADADPKPIQLRGHLGPVFAVAVNADGTIASGGGDRTIRLWSEDAPLSPQRQSDASFLGFAQSKVRVEESKIFVTGKDGQEFRTQLPRDFGPVADAAVSSDGRGMVVAPRHGHPLLFLRYDVDVPVAALASPDSEWVSIVFIENDSRIAAKTSDGTAYIWPFVSDVPSLKQVAAEKLPFQGSERIAAPPAIRCTLVEQPSDECELWLRTGISRP
jgi:WD40 repeat protein